MDKKLLEIDIKFLQMHQTVFIQRNTFAQIVAKWSWVLISFDYLGESFLLN